MNTPIGISLSELVIHVADELRRVRENNTGDSVMQFTECELQLNAKINLEAGVGLKLWLIDVMSMKTSGEDGHIIKLKFSALPNATIQAGALLEEQNRHNPFDNISNQSSDLNTK